MVESVHPSPAGPVEPGINNFDPASYSAWVTVLGGTLGGYVMQDLQLQVRGSEGEGGTG